MRDILNEAWGPGHWDVILRGGRCCWVTERRQGSRKRARRMWHPNTLAWLGGRERLNALSILGSFLLLSLRSQIPRHTVALCTPLLSNHSTWTLMLSPSPEGWALLQDGLQLYHLYRWTSLTHRLLLVLLTLLLGWWMPDPGQPPGGPELWWYEEENILPKPVPLFPPTAAPVVPVLLVLP